MGKHSPITSRLALAALAASFAQVAVAKTHHAPPPPPGPTNQELQDEIQELQSELQQTQLSAAQANNKVDNLPAPKPVSGWWDNTSISGRMYWDFSNVTDKVNGAKTGTANGTGFDVKRFYLGVDHKFNNVFAANLTTDVTYDSTTKATQLYIKKAYLQAKVSDALTFRFGSADLPWIPFVEDLYGYRYLENTLIDRTKFGTSADWGVHALGKLHNGLFNYDVAVINGAGYKDAPGFDAQHHFNTLDFEGRANVNLDNFTFGLGGYVGKLGKDVQGATTHHDASRFDAIAAYTNKQFRAGVEYFHANDWNNVTSTTSDTADGESVFGSYYFTPQWGVFGRYDHVEPTKTTNSSLKDNYYTVGLSYSPAKIVDFSLAYKHEKAEHGNLGTSNGTIGGPTSTTGEGTYDEIGVFSQLRW